jgi:hypothetical protein
LEITPVIFLNFIVVHGQFFGCLANFFAQLGLLGLLVIPSGRTINHFGFSNFGKSK